MCPGIPAYIAMRCGLACQDIIKLLSPYPRQSSWIFIRLRRMLTILHSRSFTSIGCFPRSWIILLVFFAYTRRSSNIMRIFVAYTPWIPTPIRTLYVSLKMKHLPQTNAYAKLIPTKKHKMKCSLNILCSKFIVSICKCFVIQNQFYIKCNLVACSYNLFL